MADVPEYIKNIFTKYQGAKKDLAVLAAKSKGSSGGTKASIKTGTNDVFSVDKGLLDAWLTNTFALPLDASGNTIKKTNLDVLKYAGAVDSNNKTGRTVYYTRLKDGATYEVVESGTVDPDIDLNQALAADKLNKAVEPKEPVKPTTISFSADEVASLKDDAVTIEVDTSGTASQPTVRQGNGNYKSTTNNDFLLTTAKHILEGSYDPNTNLTNKEIKITKNDGTEILIPTGSSVIMTGNGEADSVLVAKDPQSALLKAKLDSIASVRSEFDQILANPDSEPLRTLLYTRGDSGDGFAKPRYVEGLLVPQTSAKGQQYLFVPLPTKLLKNQGFQADKSLENQKFDPGNSGSNLIIKLPSGKSITGVASSILGDTRGGTVTHPFALNDGDPGYDAEAVKVKNLIVTHLVKLGLTQREADEHVKMAGYNDNFVTVENSPSTS